MEIRPATNRPGMFCLFWEDSGVEGGFRFTKIETSSGKPEQDAVLMNGINRVETLCIKAHSVRKFFNKANEAGVPICKEVTRVSASKKVAA